MPDEIMRELWATKDRIARECGHDLRQLFERLKAVERSSSHPTINRMRRLSGSAVNACAPAPESTEAQA